MTLPSQRDPDLWSLNALSLPPPSALKSCQPHGQSTTVLPGPPLPCCWGPSLPGCSLSGRRRGGSPQGQVTKLRGPQGPHQSGRSQPTPQSHPWGRRAWGAVAFARDHDSPQRPSLTCQPPTCPAGSRPGRALLRLLRSTRRFPPLRAFATSSAGLPPAPPLWVTSPRFESLAPPLSLGLLPCVPRPCSPSLRASPCPTEPHTETRAQSVFRSPPEPGSPSHAP